MPVPGSVTTSYNNTYVSSFDVHKPDILNELFARYGDQGLSDFMFYKTLGRPPRKVSQNPYYHFEDDKNNPTFSSRTNVSAPGTGLTMNITLSVGDLNSNNQFYPQVKRQVFFKGGKKGIITAIDVTTPSAPVLTVAPMQAGAAYALPAVTAGEEMSIVSFGNSEGSFQPAGQATSATRFSNNTQIIANTITATGAELSNQTWLRLNGIADAPLYTLAFTKMEWRQAKDISSAITFGVPGDDSILDPETGLPILYTEGLVTLADRLGNPRTYTAGSYSIADFDSYSRILQREFVTGPVSYRCGQDHFADLENGMMQGLYGTMVKYDEAKKYIDSTGIQSTEAMSVQIGFSYLQKAGRLFCFSLAGDWSNPQTFGIAGSSTPSLAVITPMAMQKDPKSKEMVAPTGYTYKGFGDYNRQMQIWGISGAGDKANMQVLEQDISKTFIRSEIGFEGFGANQWITVRAN